MSQKILVAYASRGGSTADIAHVIGVVLAEHGLAVDVRPMTDIHDLTPYHAVVAGSAVQKGSWLPEAIHFMNRHQTALSQKPFATFLVCLALATKNVGQQQKAKKQASAWLNPIRAMVTPMSEGFFAGVLDLKKIPALGYRILFQVVILLGFFSEGDFRDWDAISQWANDLPQKLLV